MAMSKQDLKQFSKSDLLGFASDVFMEFCPQRATKLRSLQRKKHINAECQTKEYKLMFK